ncbi:hypothetical protein C0Q98_19940 [Streptomyces albidoflavus]|nr:IS701 family transposase [Streptomyces albidoflavus]PAX82038.1 hypothetical protein CLM81_30160 [Streptomyces albidoflavus]RZE56323.1 hypothetical protein C0Q98_19940 [Streptomyces albidoflavus]
MRGRPGRRSHADGGAGSIPAGAGRTLGRAAVDPAPVDRRLYLPEQTWCQDAERRSGSGIPEAVDFAIKPRLAGRMIVAALAAGVPARWVTGDEVYGQDPQLRSTLEELGVGYVLAVACSSRVSVNKDRTTMRADHVASRLPAQVWQRHSAGVGAKGPRYYDWARVETGADQHGGLLIRRNPDTGELAFYLCWSPRTVPLSALVRVAGIRWCIEECFQAAKGQVGLDHYQVRHWTSWHRHITLTMLALAFSPPWPLQPPRTDPPTRRERPTTPST